MDRHRDLLQTAGQLRDLESEVLGISLSVKSLQSAVQRIRSASGCARAVPATCNPAQPNDLFPPSIRRSDLLDPCQQVSSKTRQMQAVQDTVDTIRHLTQRLKLVQKLRQALPSGTAAGAPGQLDLAKAAKIVADIEAIDQEVDLSGGRPLPLLRPRRATPLARMPSNPPPGQGSR